MLLGRESERGTIAGLVDTARLGLSRTLVVTGEPGVGKTALLDDAVASVGDFHVLRARGLEAERHIPFGGLLQLLHPVLDRIDDIPEPQAAALAGALALAEPAGSGDRFTIGAAVLSLLCRYADEGPVAVVVDDLHAMDPPSAEALVFAARRLVADPVVFLGAACSPDADELVADLPSLPLGGLDDHAAAALVERVAGPVPPTLLEPLLRVGGGNPLALVELAGDDLVALATDPEELPRRVPDAVSSSFSRRLARLRPDTRSALLVAAVCGGDPQVTANACAALGLDPGALAEAEDVGLVEVGMREVSFRHALLRATAYSRASVSERRAAHRAVADVLPVDDVGRRAWHLAETVWQPDAEIADMLAEAGRQAVDRRAYSVASGAFERSAHLSPDHVARNERLLAAAEAAWSAGLGERALALLDEHAHRCSDDRERVRELALRGAVAARTGRLAEARDLLQRAAGLTTDPSERTILLADAVHASFFLAGAPAAAAIARELRALAPSVDVPAARALGLIATGMASILTGDAAAGVEDLRAAVPVIDACPGLRADPDRLSCLMLVPLFLRTSSDGRALRDLVDEVRGEAAVGALPAVLTYVARDQATTSAWAEAAANYAESVRLAEETGQVTERLMSLAGLCWLEARQGKEQAARQHAADVLDAPDAIHVHLAEAWARFALGDLELALGSPEAALERLGELVALLERHGMADVDLVPGPELVEALLRTGAEAEARSVAASYHVAAEAKGQPWARARAARALGHLADEADLDSVFCRALKFHDETLDRFERARTLLAYGERLRRCARRVDARQPLREALQHFEELGAGLWATRASAELAATGETVRHRDVGPRSALTPQELQVCLLLVEGRTTREAAAALFLSPKTVEYHLRKVYTKLGVGSRRELAEALS
ncbi:MULTISPECIES: helix-turn-helix transcriptional regulator [unclassified Nocardioides]|uniref:helix-turn-helix transcriptional regulator n=1 Tax=unclassified Nocardioides TaxID=2615069 RepID=UPI00361C9187